MCSEVGGVYYTVPYEFPHNLSLCSRGCLGTAARPGPGAGCWRQIPYGTHQNTNVVDKNLPGLAAGAQK